MASRAATELSPGPPPRLLPTEDRCGNAAADLCCWCEFPTRVDVSHQRPPPLSPRRSLGLILWRLNVIFLPLLLLLHQILS